MPVSYPAVCAAEVIGLGHLAFLDGLRCSVFLLGEDGFRKNTAVSLKCYLDI